MQAPSMQKITDNVFGESTAEVVELSNANVRMKIAIENFEGDRITASLLFLDDLQML